MLLTGLHTHYHHHHHHCHHHHHDLATWNFYMYLAFTNNTAVNILHKVILLYKVMVNSEGVLSHCDAPPLQ